MTHAPLTATVTATYAALFTAGLVSSLHCIGMCGPILAGFARLFDTVSLTVNGRPRGRALVWDFAFYHAGRLWTYAVLGYLAGLAGDAVQQGSALAGGRAGGATVLGLIVVVTGLLLFGVGPTSLIRKILPRSAGCTTERLKQSAWFRALFASRGPAPRLLLGVTMGLLPCGLVYAMLALTATLPTPWHSALGMIVFGLGTLPSLTAVLVAGRAVPVTVRAHGVKIVAAMVIAAGLWMILRAQSPHTHNEHPHAHQPVTPITDQR